MSESAESPKSLICKLAAIVANIDHVEKKGRNEFQKYNYVRAADLANAVRRKLSEHKVFMLSDVIHRETTQIPAKDGGTWLFENIDVLYTFHDGESGEKLCFKMPGTGADKGDKAIYKAITGSLKYALRNAFLVPDEAADPEADETTDKEAGKQAAADVAARKTAQSASSSRPSAPSGASKVIWLKVATIPADDESGAPGGQMCLITGYTAEIRDWLVERFAYQMADGPTKGAWVLDPEHEVELRDLCEKLGIAVLKPNAPEQRQASATPAHPIIESMKETKTKKGQPMAFVKWDGEEWATFDTVVIGHLKASKGQPVDLITQTEGKYKNIVGIKSIGDQQFDEDGKTPIIQRGEQ